MACFSSSGNTKLTAIKQLVFGTVPAIADSSTQIHPFVSASPESARSEIADPSLNGSREETSVRLGGESTTFDLEFAHRPEQYDDFLEAGLFGEWDNNVLEVDSIENPMCMFLEQADIGVTRKYQDCLPNSFTLSAPLDGIATLSLNMIGTSQKVEASPDTTPVDQVAGVLPYMHFDGQIEFDGSAIGYIQDVAYTVNNNLTSVGGWSSISSICSAVGGSEITINLTAQFADASFVAAAQDETEHSFWFQLNDPTSSKWEKHEFTRVRVMSVSAPISGDGQVIQTMVLKALRNTVTGTSAVKITRSA